ncbi:DUF5518 domain-containing protein [Niastella sp. OAS944]|uniref:DUF5518 domain-containing protein n=1 Tax=Niastella sp. OAS944 TaxID=2664089 RepID=UPI00348293D2|nr:putative membrane protein YeaQ/YmgE (transglycosylase-associated protein family) [Chitinophagaceae bacterium OAS944]
MLGGSEMLVISAIIGGIIGYFKRNKRQRNGALAGIILGFVGAIVVTLVLSKFVFGSIFLIPVYAIAGALLFIYGWAKLQN